MALVGALATIAIVNVTGDDMPASTFLAQQDGSAGVAFNQYISAHSKSYLIRAEYNARLTNFKKSYDYFQGHDAAKEGFSVALNAFADFSDEEIIKLGGL